MCVCVLEVAHARYAPIVSLLNSCCRTGSHVVVVPLSASSPPRAEPCPEDLQARRSHVGCRNRVFVMSRDSPDRWLGYLGRLALRAASDLLPTSLRGWTLSERIDQRTLDAPRHPPCPAPMLQLVEKPPGQALIRPPQRTSVSPRSKAEGVVVLS